MFVIVVYLIAACYALPIDNSSSSEETVTQDDDDDNISTTIASPVSKLEFLKSIVKKSAEEIRDVLDETEKLRISRDTARESESAKVQHRRNYQSLYPKYYEEAEWPALI